MTITIEYHLEHSVKVNQQAKYLGQKSCNSKVIVSTHTHTHLTNCSTWTNKVVGNDYSVQYQLSIGVNMSFAQIK